VTPVMMAINQKIKANKITCNLQFFIKTIVYSRKIKAKAILK